MSASESSYYVFMATSKIPRKYDFTKNRWPGSAYETLGDEELQNKINEIDDDTRRLTSIPQNYKNFINDLKKDKSRIFRVFMKNISLKHMRIKLLERLKLKNIQNLYLLNANTKNMIFILKIKMMKKNFLQLKNYAIYF